QFSKYYRLLNATSISYHQAKAMSTHCFEYLFLQVVSTHPYKALALHLAVTPARQQRISYQRVPLPSSVFCRSDVKKHSFEFAPQLTTDIIIISRN
ncbi:hypothetical protein, partial [Lacticaseibacillus pantheris]|uniref:hypothetical protein n=1 Tax=Lacticaseibacillus pantheris TaxID=171523 RepID=UPI001F3F42FA